MAAHSSTLAWKIPWREEPGRLQSMGSLGVGHALPPISGALLEVSSSLYSLGSLQWGFILGHLMGPTSSQGPGLRQRCPAPPRPAPPLASGSLGSSVALQAPHRPPLGPRPRQWGRLTTSEACLRSAARPPQQLLLSVCRRAGSVQTGRREPPVPAGTGKHGTRPRQGVQRGPGRRSWG